MTRLYSKIVGGGGVSPSYFLDEMTWQEAEAFLDGMVEAEHTSWERTRCIVHAVVQCNSSRKVSPQDVMKFPWEDEGPKHQDIDWAEVERLREEVKLEQQMNSNGSK